MRQIDKKAGLELATNDSMSSVSDKLKSLSLYCEGEEIYFDLAVDWLCEGLCNIEKLSRNEILEMFECFLIAHKDKGWLSFGNLDVKIATLVDIIYTSQSSLQTCIDASDENLIKLIDSVLRLIMEEPTLKVVDFRPRTYIFGVLEKKLRFLRDLLGNEELEIWECLLPKIHNTAYGIAVFVLFNSFTFSNLHFQIVLLAIYLVCEIELLEQEIQVGNCDRNLEVEGLKGHNVLVSYVGIFAQVLRHDAIELLDSMSCLFHHPQILYIHGEVEHMKCFLEDWPKLDARSVNLKHVLSQIWELNIKTRLVIHKLNVKGTADDSIVIIMDNELPFLIEKAKLIRAEIEKIPLLAQLPVPSHLSLKNGLGFIVSLLQNLSHVLNSKIDWIATIYDDIKLIYEELEKLSLFLKEISNQHTWHGFIDDLQRDIIEVAYKAENVVDSIMLKSNDGHLSDLTPPLCIVSEEAKRINEKIAMLRDENKIGLNEKIAKFHDDKKVASSQIFMINNDEEVVGFDEETQIIIDQLTRGPVELDVISIIGMAGSGKTTLARKVYSQREIVDHFDIQAWYTVSQNYDKKQLLFEIYKQVCRAKDQVSKDSGLTEDEVANVLRKSLMGHRYLIVLDDMWDTEVWDYFRRLLSQGEEQGSRIIITTRLDEVASYTKCHGNPLYLRSLNHEESWKLLVKKTFHNGNLPQDLSSVQDKILNTCKGLPLMIVLVAGILSRLEPEAQQWGEVVKNLSSHITTGEDSSSMMVIELSYKHLPDYLKPCFLYFGAFQEDEEISASKVIKLWIAEGFVQKSVNKVFEDVAKDQLNALISCSLVMVRRRGRCSGDAKVCGVHDLVHAFCLKKAREENFLQKIQEDDIVMSSLIFDNYRLIMGGREYNRHSNIISSCWVRDFGVRSFAWTSSSSLLTFRDEHLWLFYKFKLVRILDLLSLDVYYPTSYSGLQSLVHLRYLALRTLSFYKFPSNLLNLESILVRLEAYSMIILPQTIWRMVHLRHINLPFLKVHGYGVEFFDRSSNLDNLQCIGKVELTYCEDENKDIIRKFPNLRKIECYFLPFKDVAENCYQFPKLDFLHRLESLHILGYTRPGEIDRCKFYLPPNLKRLKLARFSVPWKEISVIPTLANLEKLVLSDEALQEKKWDVEDSVFLKLKILGLHMLDIEEWVASADSFPCLEELDLRRLDYLKEVPLCFEEICTFRKIEIYSHYYQNKSLVNSVMKIKQGKEDLGGELTVHIHARTRQINI